MNQKFLKKLIKDCPLNNFTEDENSSEKHKKFDEYLEQFTDFLYENENKLIQQFWENYIASSEVGLLQISKMLRRCFLFLDCAAAIYNYTAKKKQRQKDFRTC